MKYWIICFFFFVSNVSAQVNCLTISSSEQYFSASGQGQTEEEAKATATAALVSQISSFVTTRTDMRTSIENQIAQQSLVNLSTSSSQLRLDGLNYTSCNFAKKPEKGYTILAYIKKEDLERSASFIAKEVEAQMSFISTKKALDIDYVSEAYQAYLTTFFTPYPIPYQDGVEKIDNVKPYLERYIRNYFNNIEVSCTAVELDPLYPQDHFVLTLKIADSKDINIKYSLDISSLNAKSQLDNSGGKVHVIFQPFSAVEVLKGKIQLKSAQLPANLEEIAKTITFSRDIDLTVDFSKIIELDFVVVEEKDYVKLVPALSNLSVKNIEWFSKGQLISSAQSPKVPKDEIGSDILLRVNKQDNLSIKKEITLTRKDTVVVNTSPAVLDSLPSTPSLENLENRGNDLAKGTPFSKIVASGTYDFQAIKSFLEELKASGTAVYGNKSDFVNPDKCWVILIDPEIRYVEHILQPFANGRQDVKGGLTFSNFESQLKGLVAVWVEFY